MTDSTTKLTILKEKLLCFFDETKEIETRLKSAQDFTDSFEFCAQNALYQEILKELYERSQKFLLQTNPVFIQEYPLQLIRKHCLEIFTKIPNNEVNKQHSKGFMNTLMKLIEIENEENTSICVRLLVDIHKTQRPAFSQEVLSFLKFVRNVYKELQNHTNKIFCHPTCYMADSLDAFPVDTKILETFTITKIVTNELDATGNKIEYNLLPKSCYSLKVMHEIPVLLVLMYQFHKNNVSNEIATFIPLIMEFLNLVPNDIQKKSPDFNQVLYLDFLAAQVKTLSFLAYVVKFFKKHLVEKYADLLVQGMYKMIINIPSDVTNMRKEYFIATRHILGVQEIKPRFNKVLEKLMDEEILIGHGYTVNQLLRPLAYSTLADLIHFVKNDLNLQIIGKATNMYIKNMHDDTLVFSIQQMSMKLLLNFIEPIKNKAVQNINIYDCRQLMLNILYALVQRLETVRKYFLPRLEKECLTEVVEKPSTSIDESETKIKPEEQPEDNDKMPILPKPEEKSIKPEHNLILPLLSLQDLRTLTKHLIHGIKTVTKELVSLKNTMQTVALQQSTTHEQINLSVRFLDGNDVVIYIKLIKNALRVMDLYLIYSKDGQYYKRTGTMMNPKALDEKNILDSIAYTFLQLTQANFKEVFENQIEFIIKRTVSNSCIIQLFTLILNSTNEETAPNSSILANLMLTYLLEKMEVIGEGTPESHLYVRLFRLIFNSVHNNLGCFENVLEMHLKRIVLGCMHHALSAKEPNSFMCLLRYLFRSIGGGAHEKLYKEFLPLLPLMLTGLSRLLRSPHVNTVRDLLGELCVIVPVRLSTLLPHLSLLMEPLVHVLSCNTISQGLRTLELCVDNMTPDYLYQNMYPVRGDIMFAMLKSFRFKSEQVNRTAFKVLGKMGRFNRVDLTECQNIRVDPWNTDRSIEMQIRYKSLPDDIIYLPIKEVIKTCLLIIKTEKADSVNKDKLQRYEMAYQSLKSFLLKFIESFEKDLKMSQFTIGSFSNCLANQPPSNVEYAECKWLGLYSSTVMAENVFSVNSTIDADICNIPDYSSTCNAKEYMLARQSLFGIILGCLQDLIRKNEFENLVSIINQFIFCSMAEQTNYCNNLNSNNLTSSSNTNNEEKRPEQLLIVTNLLVDAISDAHAYEDKDCVRLGTIFIEKTCKTMISAFSSHLEASRLPIFTLFIRKIIFLLHSDAWYTKWGGCSLLMLLINYVHPVWLWSYLLDLIKSLFYATNDLHMQICQHALKMTRDCLEMILNKSFSKEMLEYDRANYDKLLLAVTEYCTHLLLSENEMVREESNKLIRLLCRITDKTLNTLLQPQLYVVSDLIPPNIELFLSFPITKQIAVLELNYLFGNHNNSANCVHYDTEVSNHEKFLAEIRSIIESPIGSEDDNLGSTSMHSASQSTMSTSDRSGSSINSTSKLYSWNLPLQDSGCKQAYLSIEIFKSISLKVAACKLLSTLWYIDTDKEKNFQALFKAMCSKHAEIHETAFKCLQEFLSHTPVSLELRNANLKPLLTTFRENYSLATNRQLFYCAKLFVASFSERMCESLINKIKPTLESIFLKFDKEMYVELENDEKLQLLIKTIELFHVLQAASNKYVQALTEVVLKVEQRIFCCSSSPLRKPLILYLSKCPVDTVKLFLHSQNFVENTYARMFFLDCLKLPEAKPIREHLQTQSDTLMEMLQRKTVSNAILVPGSSQHVDESILDYDIHHYAISIIYRLSKMNTSWWHSNSSIANAVKAYWISDSCSERMGRIDKIHYSQWKDLDHILHLMVEYVENHPDNYEFLFSIAKSFKIRALGSHHKLRKFLTDLYSSKSAFWKQTVFRHYIEEACNKTYSIEMLYLVFSNIILPMFCEALEKVVDPEEKIQLLGGPPRPNDESDDIITVFLNKLIDKQEYNHGGLKVSYYQFCILILEYAPNYIHEVSNKKKGHKARIILTFAWPSLTSPSQFTDLLEKYVGLQTLAYLISKFNISRSIIVRVFVSLVKGNIVEPKKVVNAALDVLVPAWLQRKDDINFLILHTKKVATDDITSQSHLHIGNLIVRHADIYYQAKSHMQPLLHHFIMRLNNQNFQPEQRRSLLDMLELVIRWDIQSKEEMNTVKQEAVASVSFAAPSTEKQLKQTQKETLVNLIIRLLVQTLEQNQTNSMIIESSCKRVLKLIETALHPKVWGPVNLNLDAMARYFKFDMPIPNNINAQVQTQYNNMFTCLDLITNFIKIMNDTNILTNMKVFSKFLCDILTNPKIGMGRFMRYFGMLLKTLLSRFPAEASNKPKITIHGELIDLYNTVLKVIQESFGSYEAKPSNSNSTRVQSALLLLNMTQQAKTNSYAFVDRCLMNLVNMGLKLVAEIKANFQNEDVEQLIGAIDIIKSRFNVLGADMRRNKVVRMFVEAISIGKDGKLIKVVINALRNWMKLPKNEEHFAPSIREKSELFVKLWSHYSAWSDNAEIQKEILSVLILVFDNEQLQIEDVDNTFQVAFCHGIVSNSYEVRQKYLNLYSKNVRGLNLLERFVFLISVNKWDNKFFPLVNWIPTFLEILLYDIKEDDEIEFVTRPGSLLNRTSLIVNNNNETTNSTRVKSEMMSLDVGFSQMSIEYNDEIIQHHLIQQKSPNDKAFKNSIYDFFKSNNMKLNITVGSNYELQDIYDDHVKRWNLFSKNQVSNVIQNIISLSYLFNNVSDELFQNLFVQLWNLMLKHYSEYAHLLKQELIRFISNPCHDQHIGQSTVDPFYIFLGALTKIPNFLEWLHDSSFACLTSSHNQWFLGTMILEDCLYRLNSSDKFIFIDSYDLPNQIQLPRLTNGPRAELNGVVIPSDYLMSLNSMYEILEEEDYQFGLWTEKCPLTNEMKESLAAGQKSDFDKALRLSNEAYRNMSNNMSNTSESADVIIKQQKFFEFNLRFLKKMGHWDALDRNFNEENVNYYIRGESLWRKGNWKEVQHVSKQAQCSLPETDRWKAQLINFYSLIMNKVVMGGEETFELAHIEKEFQKVTSLILQQWKSLPDKSFISTRHVSLLKACNLATEAWDGLQIFNTIRNGSTSSTNEVKSLIKSWKNRLPNKNDSFSFWTDLLLWRKCVFEKLLHVKPPLTETLRAFHHEIYLIYLELIRNSRKQHLSSSTRIYAEKLKSLYPEIVLSSFACYKQECKIKMLEEGRRHSYVESLEMLENIDAQKFKDKRDLAKFFCYKAVLFSYFNKGDDATLNFGYALQMDPNNSKIWSIYADFLENVFSNYPPERRLKASHTTGIFAITALVEAASPLKSSSNLGSNQNPRAGITQPVTSSSSSSYMIGEDKLCPNLAKCLWLVTLDGPSLLMARQLEDISGKLPAITLLPWIRSLLMCLMRPEAKHIEPMILRVANEFPEAVYQPLKCLREQFIETNIDGGDCTSPGTSESTNIIDNLISKIRKNNSCKLYMLDQLCDNMEWLSCMWSEQLYGQFIRLNEQLYDYSFRKMSLEGNFNVLDEVLPEFIVTELNNLHSLLDYSSDRMVMEVDNDTGDHYTSRIHKLWAVWLGLTNNEAVVKQYQMFFNSKYCQDIRSRFNVDFDNLSKMKIRVVLNKFKKIWIPMLCKIISLQAPRSYIDERNQMLLDIGKSSGDLSLPGDLSITKRREHRLNIASIIPIVKTRWINNTFSKVITIKASNGHNFQYLTLLDNTRYMSFNTDIRKCNRSIHRFWFQERIFQLFRAVNESLNKQRESFRRGIKFLIPRVMEINKYGFYMYQIGEGINPILHRNIEDEDLKFVSLKDIWIRHKLDRMNNFDNSSKEILNDPKYYILKKLSDESFIAANTSQYKDLKHKKILECFKDISNISGDAALVTFSRYFLKSAEDYWNFRKNITIDLAVLNLSQFIFKISSLNPYQYIFEIRKGKIQILDPQIELNKDDLFTRSHKYSFRLTPNLVKFIQPSGDASSLWSNSNQPYTNVMLVASNVLQYGKNNLMAHIRAILRDYLIVWYHNLYKIENNIQSEFSNCDLENWLNSIVDSIYKDITISAEEQKCIKDQIQISSSPEYATEMTLSFESWI